MKFVSIPMLVIAALLAGCVAKYPDDIRVLHIAVVDNREQHELNNGKRPRPLLRVEFESEENLHEYARENSYPVSAVAFFCEWPSKPVYLGKRQVFWQGRWIRGIGDFTIAPSRDGKYLYYIPGSPQNPKLLV